MFSAFYDFTEKMIVYERMFDIVISIVFLPIAGFLLWKCLRQKRI